MEDFHAYWPNIKQLFLEAFGQERVTCNDISIAARFNLDDPNQFAEFDQFGKTLHEHHIQWLPDNNMSGSLIEAVLPIPDNLEKMSGLLAVAKTITAKPKLMPNGETHRLISLEEPGHILEENTGVQWNHVSGSPYDSHVVEAVLPKVEEPSRTKQEYGVGYILRPKDGRTIGEIKEWLGHLQGVEGQKKLKPRTLIPGDWVSRNEIGKIEVIEPGVKKALTKTFGGRE